MARYLFVNQYYWPDFASTGQHLTDLCEYLVSEGHEVRVLCSRGRYLEGKGAAPSRENRNGVSIFRVGASSFGKRNHLGRLADYLSFHALSMLRVAFSRWPDVVITLTTPPLIGVVGLFSRIIGGAKHVNFLMDLHPDAEFECGMIKRTSLSGRLLERIAATILRRADMNVVLGPYQGQRVLDRGVNPERVAEIPVWSDGREIQPIPHFDNVLRSKLGWQDRFVVMYSGNAGLVHGFDEILEAATLVAKSDPDVLFAFVGGGPRKAEIQAYVVDQELGNVSFLPYFDREELRFSLSAADVHFMSLLPKHVGVAVPGKLYGILAAGRPVLFAGSPQCESAETIVAAEAGFVFEPGTGRQLADTILALKNGEESCAKLGASGREYFLKVHEREVCIEAWSQLLESVAVSGEAAEVGDPTSQQGSPEASANQLDRIPAALPASKTREVEPRVK